MPNTHMMDAWLHQQQQQPVVNDTMRDCHWSDSPCQSSFVRFYCLSKK